MGRNKALLEVNGERMVETAYRRMWETWITGGPPAHFILKGTS